MSFDLPPMSALQYAVCRAISFAGRSVQATELSKKSGLKGPRFYQLMNRIRDAGWIRHRITQVSKDDERTATSYAITKKGLEDIRLTQDFYERKGH